MIAGHAGIVLIVTGAMTASAVLAAVAPTFALEQLFGIADPDRAIVLIARHWALLVASVGCLLVFAGASGVAQGPVILAGLVEKIAIVALLLASPFRSRPLARAIVIADGTMSLLYLALLAAGR